ncbi:putative DNA binding domain-containing protein [Salegentibacter mishustinae]|uniref:ATP-binding protein n=1 Tax=Salegentibacter mishustinae TaxID=270918 RepID=UPI001CE0ACAE|nr:ATP-binding protein [Salegentibacter mishustinae]UBZ06168.1 putative DNA binding domain-containing protein [Salegentibacter mishustinae]
MKERKLSEKEIIQLCERDENHFYDNKAFEIKGDKIQKIAVAFANADGGEFIIGIKDKKEEKNALNRWQGIQDIESFNFVFQNLTQLSPTIPHSYEFLKDNSDKYALRITIEKSESVHKTANNTVYIRKSAQSLPIRDPLQIQALSYSKGESSYEDTLVNSATAEDIFESEEINNFLSDYSPQSDPIDFTVNQNLVDRKTYEPRTAGILLFSQNPTPLLPKRCGIKINRYETSEEIPERTHLKKQYSIEGCLNEQIKQASDIITNIMESVQIMGTKGLEKVKYPPETIWEILVNAVIHRDYSISDDIQVLVFNNRIEIKSPGKLPGYVTIENILDARFSRNSKLVRVLNKYKNPANKDMGEGLNTAFQKMEEFRLEPPKIFEDGNYIKVVISHTSLASPEERVMEYLEINEQIKNRQAREISGVKSENVMKRHFYDLRDKGLIEPVMSKTGKKVVAWKKKN